MNRKKIGIKDLIAIILERLYVLYKLIVIEFTKKLRNLSNQCFFAEEKYFFSNVIFLNFISFQILITGNLNLEIV